MTPNIELHIDTLMLHGFERVNRARLHAAVTGELARLFAEQGAPPHESLHRTPRLDAGTIHATPDTPSGALGVQIAQAIYRGLNR